MSVHTSQLLSSAERAPQVRDLTDPERLLLSAYRRWLTGLIKHDANQWERVWRELSSALGSDSGRRTLLALEVLLRCMADYARRTISYQPPCCGMLNPDERLLLGLVRNARTRAAPAIAEALVLSDGIADVIEAARELQAAMRDGGAPLPMPSEPQCDLAEWAPSHAGNATVH